MKLFAVVILLTSALGAAVEVCQEPCVLIEPVCFGKYRVSIGRQNGVVPRVELLTNVNLTYFSTQRKS